MDITKFYELYDTGCKADAPVIMFIPGVGCSGALFHEALKCFMPHYRVILFNNPGTGGAPMSFLLSVPKIADKAIAVLNHLNITKCIIVGHSMGGFTSQRLAIKTPEKVEKLVLISTSYGGKQNEDEALRLAQELGFKSFTMSKEMHNNPLEALKWLMSTTFVKDSPEKYAEFVSSYKAQQATTSVIARHFICVSRASSLGEVHNIKAPTLVVHGSVDNLINIEAGKKLSRQIANSRYWEVDNTGHLPFAERENFWHIVKGFIEGDEVGVKSEVDPHPHAVYKPSLAKVVKKSIEGLFSG